MKMHAECGAGSRADRHAVALLLVGASIAGLLLAGCSSPPPALPTSVLAKGEEGLSDKHPKLSDAQRKDCKGCHREVPDPVQKP